MTTNTASKADANLDDQKVESSEEQQSADTQETAQETEVSVSDTEKRVAELQAELTKTQEILEKARKGEKYHKQSKSDLEKQVAELSKYKDLYEQTQNQIRTQAVDTALTKAAEQAKAKNVAAVLKLIDKNEIAIKDGAADAEAVAKAIEKVKSDVAELFEAQELPTPKRAAEGATLAGYDVEIRNAKSIKEIEAILKKYNKV